MVSAWMLPASIRKAFAADVVAATAVAR